MFYSPSAATAVTARRASCRSSSGSSAQPTGPRSPSRCSKARRAIRPRSPLWSIRSVTASVSRMSRADRGSGMPTAARIREELHSASTGSRGSPRSVRRRIRKVIRAGALQPSLVNERNLAKTTSDDFLGVRLIARRNPLVAEVIAAATRRKRQQLCERTLSDFAPARCGCQKLWPVISGNSTGTVRPGRVPARIKY